jgi:sugar phosphate isomerase/epimerase
MIYVSSSCVQASKIGDSVKVLADLGFKNIELSGGTRFYPEYESDLDLLKNEYDLNFRCHNYFPPPRLPFVLNLASLDEEVRAASVSNITEAIRLSRKYADNKIGLHSGFYIDIKNNEIGKKIGIRSTYDKKDADNIFYQEFSAIAESAKDIEFYLENNVVSSANYKTYNQQNVFMLTSKGDHMEMSKHINFKCLLDVAHLKVSCKTLSLNYKEQFNYFINISDYVHISDNNSLADQNSALAPNGEIVSLLRSVDLTAKDFTLEIYSGIADVKQAFLILEGLIHA